MVGDFSKKMLWLLCLVLIFSTTFALGQGIVAGNIAGTVVDPQKAVVTGAKVGAKNVATSVEFKATTNDQGYFSIRSIPPGTYRVAVEAPNFKRLDIDGVVVNTGATTDMGALTLALGTTAETVTVEGAAPLIETTSAQGGATFSATAATNLPLNGGFDQLALFTPGVQTAGNAGIFANSNGASFGANGQRDRSNTFQIDGQFNNDTVVTGPAIFFANQDALQEVQIVTNNFGVEYGRTSGATVNYVTKSGTNNYHGSAFEYYTGNWGDSETHQETISATPSVARYTENRWGGTLGGPIIPNKMFFFTSFLQDTVKGSSSPSTSLLLTPVPGPTGLGMLNTCYPGNPAVTALNNIGPYAIVQGSPVPFGTPQTLTLTGGCQVVFNGVSRSLPSLDNDYEAIGRVDMVLSPKDQLFVRYLFTQPEGEPTSTPGQFGVFAEEGSEINVSRNQQAALDWTRNWTNHLVNQVRFSYVREFSGFLGGAYPACSGASLGACPTFYFMGAGLLTFGQGVNLPQSGLTNNSQWQDNASWQHGRHLVKFGGEYDRQRAPNVFLPDVNGEYIFTSAATAAAEFNTLLAGVPDSVNLTQGNATIPFKEQDANLYLGDDWRIRENLTLNLGIRWEFTQQGINNLAANTVTRQTGPDPFWSTALPLSQTTLPQVPNHYDHFAPSFGFAWTPHMFESLLGHDKTVIRGGFRLSYDPEFYNIFLNVASAAPAVNSGSFSALACPGSVCPIVSYGAEAQAQLGVFIPTGGNPGARANTRVTQNFTNPYAEEWTLGVQRELSSKLAAEVRYVGTHTVHEFQTINGNPVLCYADTCGPGTGGLIGNGFANVIPAGVTPCTDPSAPGYAANNGTGGTFANCNHTLFRLRENGATGHYNSLQSQLKFQNWHGLTAVAAYTWSKNDDNASEIYSTYGPSPVAGPQNPFCPGACERGLSALDYPQNFTLYWNYEMPFGKGQTGLMGRLLGGWGLGGTYHYTSGQVWSPFEDPFTSSSCNDDFNSHFFGVSSCRPFAGNYGAPVNTVGIICNGLPAQGTYGMPGFVPAECPSSSGGAGVEPFGTLVSYFDPCLNTGGNPSATPGVTPQCGVGPTTKAAVHWIINDDSSAKFFGTPFGTVRRDPGVRGQTVNTVNLNLIKNNRVSEKVNLKLEMNVYNLFNHQFLGVPGADITSDGSCFGSVACGDSGGINYDSGAGPANGIGTGLAQRRIILGAHIIF